MKGPQVLPYPTPTPHGREGLTVLGNQQPPKDEIQQLDGLGDGMLDAEHVYKQTSLVVGRITSDCGWAGSPV